MNFSKFNLSKKNIFILGSEGLIGKKTSEVLYLHGAKLICIDKISKKKIKKKNYYYQRIDISNLKIFKKQVEKLYGQFGVPDVFINCSYPKTMDWKNNSFKKINLKSFKKNIDIHLNSFAWTAKIIADSMSKRKRGSIILLSSIYGLVGQKPFIYENTKMSESMTYSIIKGGINTLTKQMSAYYGKYNIRVNAICPGGIFNNQEKKFVKEYIINTPLKRMATPEDIAYSIVFLASDASSYITGIQMPIDGGWTAI